MNMVMIIGNVGQDPELRKTQSGSSVANFSVATTERWKSKDGEKKEATEWHRVVVWGNLADIVEKFVSKGSKVAIVGKVKTRKWEKDGVERYSTEIVLDGFDAKLELLSPKAEGGYQPGQDNASKDSGGTADLDDDIPF